VRIILADRTQSAVYAWQQGFVRREKFWLMVSVEHGLGIDAKQINHYLLLA